MKYIASLFLILAFLLSPFNYDGSVQEAQAATDIVNDATLGTGLVACWEMDESSGTRADDSGNSYDLTENGTGGIAGVAAVIDNGADFEFSDSDKFSRSDDGSSVGLDLDGGDISWSFWFKPESTGRQFIFSKSTGGFGYTFEYNSGNFTLYQRDGTGVSETSVSYSLSAATQYHIVVVFDDSANDWELYVNGSSQGSNTMNQGPSDTSATFYMGSQTTGTGLFVDGVFDIVAVAQADWTSSVSDLYNSGSGIPCVAAAAPAADPKKQDIFWFSFLTAPLPKITTVIV